MAHILIVEHDEPISTTLKRTLVQDNHQVSVAHNCGEALHVCRLNKPDLIVTDILMPSRNAIEMIVVLAVIGIKIPTVAIFSEQYFISELNLELKSWMGIKASLTKPFSIADLRRAIADALPV